MKNKIIFYLLLMVILSNDFAACVKLDENPASLIVSENFYKNQSQAVAAVTAIYRKLYESGQSLYNSLIQIGVEMATDDYEAGPRARNANVRAISNLIHDASNDRMQELWRQSYDAINAANIAIDKIPLIEASQIDETIRTRLISEAKFLRALNFFNLVRWFGAIPLQLHEPSTLSGDELYPHNVSEDSIYNQIIDDLKNASNLPAAYSDASDVGRATSGAAKSLLVKVYLTKKDWNNAYLNSKSVIESGTYGLFENFADVFNVATKNGREHIFSAQFQGNSGYQGNSLASRSAPADIPGINGDYADALHVQGGLYFLFPANDKRRQVAFVTQMVSPVDNKLYTLSKPQFFKYYDPAVIGNQGESSVNLSIIRYAEVLLMYAEAINELNSGPTPEAYWALDQVRVRAGIAKLADTAPNLSQSVFRDSVFQERRKEFVYEYNRWFDLARRGADYYVATLKAAGKTLAAPKHIHFPIPQRELNLNPNLKQNPDWQ